MKLELRTTGSGKGVFAAAAIPARSLILPFTGPLLRYDQTSAQTYALQVGPDLYIGASGGLDDYVNHSCDPNAGMLVEGTTARLVALRDIAIGEEILFDYSTTLDEDDFTMACWCGTPACRRVITDGKYLPQAVWDRYLALGILPAYVRASRLKRGGDAGAGGGARGPVGGRGA